MNRTRATLVGSNYKWSHYCAIWLLSPDEFLGQFIWGPLLLFFLIQFWQFLFTRTFFITSLKPSISPADSHQVIFIFSCFFILISRPWLSWPWLYQLFSRLPCQGTSLRHWKQRFWRIKKEGPWGIQGIWATFILSPAGLKGPPRMPQHPVWSMIITRPLTWTHDQASLVIHRPVYFALE